MHILILNWRDPKNSRSGGAEKLNLQILTPLLNRGDTVTWYAMAQPGLPQVEIQKNLKIIRRGNIISHFLFWPYIYLMGELGKPDLVFDCIHGIGYMSNLFIKKSKIVILVCEVAQNIWDEMWPFPVNIVGKLWEKKMYRLYSKCRFWAISKSTALDLVKFGVNEKNLSIIPMGYDTSPCLIKTEKYINPTAIFVGRLCEMKGVKDALKAIASLNRINIKWKLIIIGRGDSDYETEIKKMTKDLSIDSQVEFMGFVSEKEKYILLAKAWILLTPSIREGWGMTIPEANSVGTPAIGYNVPSLSEVLPYYSSANLVIPPGYQNIVEALKKFVFPVNVVVNVDSGWSILHGWVLKNI